MPNRWWPKRSANIKAPATNALGSADMVGTSQESPTSEKDRVEQAFDRALALEKARAEQASDNAESGADESYSDIVSDNFDTAISAAKSLISTSLDILQDRSLLISGPDTLKQTEQMLGIPSSLADLRADILDEAADIVGAALISAAASTVPTIHAQYRKYLSFLPTIIHPMVSFSPDTCWIIAIRDWQVAVVLPGDRDKVRDMPLEAQIAPADAMNWAKQIHDSHGIRLTKTQDQMLAALVGENSDKSSPSAFVVSPPWPPINLKVHKEREFRSWWYGVARNRVMVTWQPPVYDGGLGGTSIRVLTFPPPDSTAVPDLGTAAITVPPSMSKSSGYENLNSVYITGLDATTPYRFAVVAINALGCSNRTEAIFTF